MKSSYYLSEAEPDNRCAVASCGLTNPQLYDDHLEQYYCDRDCLEEYIAENPGTIADWYERLHVAHVDG